MTKQRRVSAKQRLEVVEEAFRILNDEAAEHRSQQDYEEFVRNVEHALHGNLTPRNAQENNV